jgi:hypothetical protein
MLEFRVFNESNPCPESAICIRIAFAVGVDRSGRDYMHVMNIMFPKWECQEYSQKMNIESLLEQG